MPPRVTPDRLTRLRADYTRQIDLVLDRAAAGEISQRRAHQQLSVLVRHFVQEVSGIHAPTMTLTELNATGLPADARSPRSSARSTRVSSARVRRRPSSGAGTVAKQVVARWS